LGLFKVAIALPRAGPHGIISEMPLRRHRESIRELLVVALMIAASAATPGIAAEFRESDRAHALVMLRDVRGAIERNYYDPTLKGVDLNASAEVAKSRINKATSVGETFSAIAQFVLELDDSHTVFIPPELTVRVDYGWDMGMVGDTCFVLRVQPDSDAARQGVAPGDRVTAVNGFRPTRANLWRLDYLFRMLRPQPGLHVELVSPSGVARELNLASQVHARKRVMDISHGPFGADWATLTERREKLLADLKPTVVELGSDALILRLPTFSVEDGLIQSILHKAHAREVMIIDLRGNRGGLVTALQELLGSLAAEDVLIGTRLTRDQSDPQIAKGTAKDAFTGRVFVLVDAESASASEVTARVIQLTNRGTVIGDQTAGAVMESRVRPLVASAGQNTIFYGVAVAEADLVMSDGGRLEKIGVRPDFVVLPSATDLATNRDPALAKALTFAGHPMDSTAAGALLPKR
jgi:carboxyl-terminal processing protease